MQQTLEKGRVRNPLNAYIVLISVASDKIYSSLQNKNSGIIDLK